MIYGNKGTPKYLGESVTGTKMGSETNDDIPNFRLIRLIGMDAGRSADKPQWIICACAMVFLPK